MASFGAVPDDGVDDTAAIQRALVAVSAAGGGTLLFSQGRYDISINPALRRALTIYPRIRMLAREGAPATLRLADGQIVYESVMAPATYPTRLDDVEFIGLTFDANGLNNPVRNKEETNGDAPGQTANPSLRYFIRSFAGSRARIANAIFTNADVGNSVSFNGTAITDVVIENSKFLNVGGALIDHDHSSIYFDGKRLRISGNEFRGRNGAGTLGARTAIETHGDDIEVRGNVVDGFLQGANIVGRQSDPSRQVFSGNTFTNVAAGLNLWPLADGPSGAAFVALTLRDNDIRINADVWWRSPAMVVNQVAGILFEADVAKARLDRLDILDNRIVFDTFSGERSDADRTSVGIGIRGVEGQLAVSNLYILRNSVRNAIGPCILNSAIVGPLPSSQIVDNILTDCARSPNLVGAGDLLRTGIVTGGVTSQIVIARNTVRSTGVVPVMLTGILVGSNCLTNCVVSANAVSGVALAVQNIGSGWAVNP